MVCQTSWWYKYKCRGGPTLIVNMYNDNKNSDSIHKVIQFMKRKEWERNANESCLHFLWLGDFNSHHPLWDKHWNSHLFTRTNLDRAQEVNEIVAKYDLQMVLHKGMLTLQAMSTGNLTRTNNVFMSCKLANRVQGHT